MKELWFRRITLGIKTLEVLRYGKKESGLFWMQKKVNTKQVMIVHK